MEKQHTTLYKYSLLIFTAGVIFLTFWVNFRYHLFLKEQIRLFVLSSDYLYSFFTKPAFLANLTGEFLTQFYYLQGGGPFLISICFLLFATLANKTIQTFSTLKNQSFYWAYGLAIAEAIMHYHLDYNISNTFAIIIGMGIYLCLHQITNSKIHQILLPLYLIISYWAIGGVVFIVFSLILLNNIKHQHLNYFLIALSSQFIHSV